MQATKSLVTSCHVRKTECQITSAVLEDTRLYFNMNRGCPEQDVTDLTCMYEFQPFTV